MISEKSLSMFEWTYIIYEHQNKDLNNPVIVITEKYINGVYLLGQNFN